MSDEFIGFTDDFMFCSVMEDEEKCKELLQRILNIEITEIKTVCKQKTIKNRKISRGVRLDIYARDVDGNKYDIDMQTTKELYLGKRTRYYHSEMDGESIRKGVKYKNLKRSIVIFICTYDCFGDNRSIYTFKSICDENKGIYLDDERETIILNALGSREYVDEKLGTFLDYVKTGIAEDEFTHNLEESVKTFNENEEWRNKFVTLEMKFDQKYEQGHEDGMEAGKELLLVTQVKDGILTIEKAAEYMGVTEEEFKLLMDSSISCD